MNKYEVIIMQYPNSEEEKRAEQMDRLKKILEAGGTIQNVDDWGLRKLAYEIEYHKDAYYTLIEFENDPQNIKEFDRVAKILDTVMRHMVVRMDE
ncbi:MAG: 30S ribosomal protein S6 [Tissierellia bacterium]|nr:30S ribosomal protein S6 [Tissierellia bacterium]